MKTNDLKTGKGLAMHRSIKTGYKVSWLSYHLSKSVRLATLSAGLAASIFICYPSFAQQADLPQWPTSCRGLSADPDQLICTISQDLRNADGQLLFRVAFQRQAWRDETLMQVRTPLELYLPKGVNFFVDGVLVKELNYERCTQSGCDLFTALTQSDIDTALSGNAIVISFWRDAETSQSVNIPLANFNDKWASISMTGKD